MGYCRSPRRWLARPHPSSVLSIADPDHSQSRSDAHAPSCLSDCSSTSIAFTRHAGRCTAKQSLQSLGMVLARGLRTADAQEHPHAYYLRRSKNDQQNPISSDVKLVPGTSSAQTAYARYPIPVRPAIPPGWSTSPAVSVIDVQRAMLRTRRSMAGTPARRSQDGIRPRGP